MLFHSSNTHVGVNRHDLHKKGLLCRICGWIRKKQGTDFSERDRSGTVVFLFSFRVYASPRKCYDYIRHINGKDGDS